MIEPITPIGHAARLSAIAQAVDDACNELLVNPDADAERQLAQYLLATAGYLIGKPRGIREPEEGLRYLAGVLLLGSERGMPYDRYLQTEHWRRMRMAALDRAEHRCQLCGANDSLQVHHNSYDRLWHERPADLLVLCRDCHARYHEVPR